MVKKHKEMASRRPGSEGSASTPEPAEHIREELLRCKVCASAFSTTVSSDRATQCHIPKVLPCSHTYCHQCISQSCAPRGRNLFPCPLCRKDVLVPRGGAVVLPDNTTVLGLLSILEGQTTSAAPTPAPPPPAAGTSAASDQSPPKLRLFRGFKRKGAKEQAPAPPTPAPASQEPREELTEVPPEPAMADEKRAEAEASAQPRVYTGTHLYPTLNRVQLEDFEDQENQPPPYSTVDRNKAGEAAASAVQHGPPPSFNSLYPNLGVYEAPGRLEMQGGYGMEGLVSASAVPLPGLANPLVTPRHPQSMRVTSPGRRTLERRLGGSMRNLHNSPDLQCNQDPSGAMRCAVDTAAHVTSVHAGLDLAQPTAGVAPARVLLNTQAAAVPRAVPVAAVQAAVRPAAVPAARPTPVQVPQQVQAGQRAPHFVINIGKSGSQPQAQMQPRPQIQAQPQPRPQPQTQLQQHMAQRQVVFLDQSSSSPTNRSPEQPRVQLNSISSQPVVSVTPAPVVTAAPVQPTPCQTAPTQPAPIQPTPTQPACASEPPKPPTREILNDPAHDMPCSPLKLLNKFGSYGERRAKSGGTFQLPTGLSVSDNGDVLVVDSNLMALQLFNSRGQLLQQLKVVGMQCACFIMGNRIAVGTHRGLEVYSRAGQRVQEFQVGPVAAVTGYGSGVLVVQSKAISGYMGAELHETQQIRKRTKPGAILKSSVGFQRLVDVAVTSNKELVILDAGAGEVYVTTEEGHTRRTISPASLPCGRLLNPSSLALDHQNNIYVCDTGNRRVLKFCSEGKFSRSLVNFTLGATSSSPSIDNTLTAYGVAVNKKEGQLLVTVSANKMAQVRAYQL